MIFNMKMSIHQSSSGGVVKEGSVHGAQFGTFPTQLACNYCRAPLEVSSFLFSAYKMYGNGRRVTGPEAAIFD